MNKEICISSDTPEEIYELKKFLNLYNLDFFIYEFKKERNSGVVFKIINFVCFLFFLKKNKIKKIIGSPNSRNRYASWFLRIPYASYMRSVHPDPHALTSLSDRIYYELSRCGIKIKILNPYEADRVFISTEINRIFLINRGIKSEKIFNVGAIWLENIECNRKNEGRIIYITQSFLSHKNNSAAQEQYLHVKKIMRKCAKESIRFVIRKHPRDDTNYYDINDFYGEINTDLPLVFLKKLSKNDLIISSFSTMALEAMSIGINVVPIKLNSIESFNSLFERLGVSVVDVDSIVLKKINIFERKNYSFFQKTNSNYIYEFFINE